MEFNTLQDQATMHTSGIEELTRQFAEGQAAIQELALLKPTLALALSKLPKKQIKLSLTDQTTLGDYELQAKREEKSGAILLRAVKAL